MVPRPCRRSTAVLVALTAALTAAGCASNTLSLRSVPKSPLVAEFELTSSSGPKASARTTQLLRVYNLSDEQQTDFRPLLKDLQAINDREPSADKVYALSELAFLGAKKAEAYDKGVALDLYGTSVLHAYDYLFDPRLAATRNPYDPNYRGACDLYNGALESALRIVCAKKELVPDTKKTIHTASGEWDITCKLQSGRWRPDEFERFEFVSDWEVKGLKNLYLAHGLGVPLIAVRRDLRKDSAGEPAAAQYYPASLSFPVTAFVRPLSKIDPATGQAVARNQCLLELYDPLSNTETLVAGLRVPLESDLTTPLAYFLSKSGMSNVATLGLLRPDDLVKPETLLTLRPGGQGSATGLYMVQPYEPGKIPVLMVHGLWSTPLTWLEMFNDLRSQPELRDRYQFWFYLYPTDKPFWLSAADLRRDLIKARQVLDPRHEEPALDQMVLIGHSMGGLVSRLQTIQSGDQYWNLVSGEPLGQLKADADARQKLAETFFFQPSMSIRRVVTIGTPHHGSTFSNQTTQWLLEKLIRLPQTIVNSQQKLFRDNQGAFPDRSLLRVETSIDSLSPNASIFPVMLASRRAPWVQYHNIVGVVPKQWWLSKVVSEGDGVVSRQSAHVDDAVSEITVPADHTTVHMHPAAVLEVRRILLEHLADLEGRSAGGLARRMPPMLPVELRVQ
jgi:pimeloyl-ACP methyl ester carboxylesterase